MYINTKLEKEEIEAKTAMAKKPFGKEERLFYSSMNVDMKNILLECGYGEEQGE